MGRQVSRERLAGVGDSDVVEPLKERGSRQREWKRWRRGGIALQWEYAEVYYRKNEIRAIPDGALDVTAKS